MKNSKTKSTHKIAFLCIAQEIVEKSNLKYIGLVFSYDGEKVVWYNNYDSLAKAEFYAQQRGKNSWVYDVNGLKPCLKIK